uniref:Uncharacterized protein n=1 Tax=Corethron hystrix TaxID=216773 RepID=A0A7S1BV04_9STRA|mmetsp:Transcript_42156/g.98804  ORF Transcript_42156/g.98804 Transcript_42156/m.98804 type:complete len:288 (+) Transcript_42156:593-1456(+)
MPLVWIRDIRRLAPTNFAATCLTAAGLAGCLALAAAQNDTDEIQNVQDLRAFGKQWYLFLGTSVSISPFILPSFCSGSPTFPLPPPVLHLRRLRHPPAPPPGSRRDRTGPRRLPRPQPQSHALHRLLLLPLRPGLLMLLRRRRRHGPHHLAPARTRIGRHPALLLSRGGPHLSPAGLSRAGAAGAAVPTDGRCPKTERHGLHASGHAGRPGLAGHGPAGVRGQPDGGQRGDAADAGLSVPAARKADRGRLPQEKGDELPSGRVRGSGDCGGVHGRCAVVGQGRVVPR